MTKIRLELPVAAMPGRLADPQLGIAAIRTSLRATHRPTLTLLDTSDLRLADAGISLSHRVVDGLGEWILASDGWEPHLPRDVVEPFGSGDLPDDMSALTTPFRRGAPLGVQGRVTSTTHTFTAVDATGVVLATMTDETMSVALSEREPQLFRIATVSSRAASKRQFGFLVGALEAVGGTRISSAPALPRLLRSCYGAGDYHYPERITDQTAMGEFVAASVRRRLRRIVEADLAFRKATTSSLDQLMGQLLRARHLVRGVAWASSADTETLLADVQAVLDQPTAAPSGERYLRVLDELVAFARSPRLGEWDQRPASTVFAQEIDSTLVSVVNRARRLDRHSPRQRWERTRASTQHCLDLTRVARRFFGSRAKGLRRRLEMIVYELDTCLPETPQRPSLDGLTPAEAFEAGRGFEHAVARADAARVEFVASWPSHQKYFKQLGIKP